MIKNSFNCKGLLDGKPYFFKVDTGSDVSIVKESLITCPKQHYAINECYLKYPTGETISVNYKVIVEIELGKYFLEIPMLVANISDDCILGSDFLEMINLDKIFESKFGNFENCRDDIESPCSRVIKEEVPSFLKTFFEENSKNLSSAQKNMLAEFLIEFRMYFQKIKLQGIAKF